MSDILKDFNQLFDLLSPPLYYALQDDCPIGKVIHVPLSKYAPEFIITNPNDLKVIQNKEIGRQLMPLKEYKGK